MAVRAVRRTDWKTKPMPEKSGSVRIDVRYGRGAFDRIRLGLYPRQMEDKWFIYYEEPWLSLHRSWTGCLIFRVRFEASTDGGRAVEVQVNRDPRQYRAGEPDAEAEKAETLIDTLLAYEPPGGARSQSGELAIGDEAAGRSWSDLGRAMLGGGPAPGYPLDSDESEDLDLAASTSPERTVSPTLEIVPCLDSIEMGLSRRRELEISQTRAAELGRSALDASTSGFYVDDSGHRVEWGRLVQSACASKVSLSPDTSLPLPEMELFPETRVQVTNETTLATARRLVDDGQRPVALNFANGTHPGGGFLGGARAQEEVLCRSSALYVTLLDDPMYEAHWQRQQPDSTDWAIYSPDVPVFRTDDGQALPQPWLASFISCAAPYAPGIGQPVAGDLLERRIRRVLAIARAFGHSTLVLGAWGCGAFGNDPDRTARDFRRALEGEFAGAFQEVVFAITDWSPERRFIGPFCEVFDAGTPYVM